MNYQEFKTEFDFRKRNGWDYRFESLTHHKDWELGEFIRHRDACRNNDKVTFTFSPIMTADEKAIIGYDIVEKHTAEPRREYLYHLDFIPAK